MELRGRFLLRVSEVGGNPAVVGGGCTDVRGEIQDVHSDGKVSLVNYHHDVSVFLIQNMHDSL